MEKIRLKSKIIDIPRRSVLRLNGRLGRYEHVTWLIGDARSGTTWVSDLINHHHRYREMFEPIRPGYVEATSFLEPNEYVHPDADHPQLHALLDEVFSGRLTHPRVDTANVRPWYTDMLVKDCFANLFAYWACRRFDQVSPVLLIRNPFAMALSKQKKFRKYWPTDPGALVAQEGLRRDYLEPYTDVIQRTSAEADPIQCLLAMWAVINMVPLKQFPVADLHVCFYEDIYEDPQGQLRAIYDFTDPPGRSTEVQLGRDDVDRPSRVAGQSSNVVSRSSPLTSWRDELTTRQIDDGIALLDRLDMGQIYGDGAVPDHQALATIRAASTRGG